MSVAKEGKVFEQNKLLQPLLDTSEGTKITWISLFLTSPTPTVYSNTHPLHFRNHAFANKASTYQGAPGVSETLSLNIMITLNTAIEPFYRPFIFTNNYLKLMLSGFPPLKIVTTIMMKDV